MTSGRKPRATDKWTAEQLCQITGLFVALDRGEQQFD
jgi:hypothetical protein